MNPRSLLLPLFALAAILLAAPRAFAAPQALVEDETVKLPCGHAIKVLSITKVEFSTGVMALMVRYQTPLSVDQSKALSQEVDDVWKLAVKDVERYGFKEAIINTNEVPKGMFIASTHTLNFLYEKGADGKWTRLNRADILADR